MEDNSIDKMAEQFKSFTELQAYSQSLYQTTIKLTQVINRKNEEIEHLKKMVTERTPILSPDSSGSILLLNDLSDQEAIAVNELRKLKDLSLVQDLTLEECRKTEIYTKILESLKKKEPKQEDLKDVDTSKLLKLIKDE